MRRDWLIVGTMLVVSGCSEMSGAPSVALPTAENLPVGVNQDCACVERNKCAMLDERLGRLEVRNVGCVWRDDRRTLAACDYDVRFVAIYAEDGEEFPEPWQSLKGTFKHRGQGNWCLAEELPG